MTIYKFSTFSYNSDTRELISGSEQQYLRKKVADVLCYLLENRERVVSKSELLDNIWQHGEYRENSLLQSIKELRKCVNESPRNPKFIRTVHLKGYEWIDDAVTVEELAPSNKSDIKTGVGHHRNKVIAGAVIVTLLSLLTFFYLPSDPDSDLHFKGGIAVLPFVNDTGDSTLQWLELGYSDMFSQGLKKQIRQQVIPMFHVQGVMAQHQLKQKQQYSEQISSLLEDMQAQIAIAATINKDGEFLRFNYRLHDVSGVFSSGSIRFPNLPSSLPSLVSQIAKQLIDVELTNAAEATIYFANEEAERDYANGVQALQGKGAKLAKRYFEASLLNDNQSLATKTKLAETLFLLGQWNDAEALYGVLLSHPQLIQDPILASSVNDGMANLLLQQNKLTDAEAYIEKGLSHSNVDNMRYQRASLLHTLAKLRQRQGRNTERHQLLMEADTLSKPFQSLQNEADALYYLGSPANVGLEIDPDIQMQKNQPKLLTALEYYKELGDKRGQALTQLAIGQNYYFDAQLRFESLKQAEEIFKETGNVSDLMDTLSYLGYFFIQYHQGAIAVTYLNEGILLADKYNDNSRKSTLTFLRGFAVLDQGLDRGEGANNNQLNIALNLFTNSISSNNISELNSVTADTYLLMSWAHAELGQYQQAMSLQEQAYDFYTQHGYVISAQYAQASLMDEQIKLQQWQQVLDLMPQGNTSYLINSYLARAHYELGQFELAREKLQQTKEEYSERWTIKDEQRLAVYILGSDTKKVNPLGGEMSSHLTYCETLWNNNNINSVITSISGSI